MTNPSQDASPARPPRAFGRYDPRRALLRLAIATVLGAATAWLLGRIAPAVRFVAAWDVTAFILLSFAWRLIWRSDPEETRRRAAAEDPGRNTVWALIVLTSSTSLFAAAVVLRQARTLAPGNAALWVALCLIAVVTSWSLTHTSWTLRYAHLYYRDDDEGEGGLVFPGDRKPDDFDFAYFAFTVGMCFQVSDVVVTSPTIRRAVLMHSCISFAYNTAIMALALNLAFGVLT
jgi:uncharacterized membrane protein